MNAVVKIEATDHDNQSVVVMTAMDTIALDTTATDTTATDTTAMDTTSMASTNSTT